MDIYSNSIPSSSPEYLFPGENNMEGGDGAVSLEWLSAFVEECLNGGGFTAQPPPPPPMPPTTNSTASRPTTVLPSPTTKARSKRRKLAPESPLVPQAYWLAESELIALPSRKEEEEELHEEEVVAEEERRRCAHCMSQKTPQWRAGPLGPKTLCNACGVRFKSGRLLPEYRPAKSPTFRTYKHSNSHKKVMEMRSMSTTVSSSSSDADADADANAD